MNGKNHLKTTRLPLADHIVRGLFMGATVGAVVFAALAAGLQAHGIGPPLHYALATGGGLACIGVALAIEFSEYRRHLVQCETEEASAGIVRSTIEALVVICRFVFLFAAGAFVLNLASGLYQPFAIAKVVLEIPYGWQILTIATLIAGTYDLIEWRRRHKAHAA